MAQAKARAYIQTESAKAYNRLVEEWDQLQKENQAAMDDSFWGGIIGSIGLPLLATVFGPVGMAVGAGLAGVGSYAGQKYGEKANLFGGQEHSQGVQGAEAIGSQGLRADMRRELGQQADITEQAFDDQILAGAVQTAGTAYLLGGGSMPGTVGWAESGGLAGQFSATTSPFMGGFSLKGVGESLYDSYLANRSVSNIPYYGNIAPSPLRFD